MNQSHATERVESIEARRLSPGTPPEAACLSLPVPPETGPVSAPGPDSQGAGRGADRLLLSKSG